MSCAVMYVPPCMVVPKTIPYHHRDPSSSPPSMCTISNPTSYLQFHYFSTTSQTPPRLVLPPSTYLPYHLFLHTPTPSTRELSLPIPSLTPRTRGTHAQPGYGGSHAQRKGGCGDGQASPHGCGVGWNDVYKARGVVERDVH